MCSSLWFKRYLIHVCMIQKRKLVIIYFFIDSIFRHLSCSFSVLVDMVLQLSILIFYKWCSVVIIPIVCRMVHVIFMLFVFVKHVFTIWVTWWESNKRQELLGKQWTHIEVSLSHPHPLSLSFTLSTLSYIYWHKVGSRTECGITI